MLTHSGSSFAACWAIQVTGRSTLWLTPLLTWEKSAFDVDTAVVRRAYKRRQEHEVLSHPIAVFCTIVHTRQDKKKRRPHEVLAVNVFAGGEVFHVALRSMDRPLIEPLSVGMHVLAVGLGSLRRQCHSSVEGVRRRALADRLLDDRRIHRRIERSRLPTASHSPGPHKPAQQEAARPPPDACHRIDQGRRGPAAARSGCSKARLLKRGEAPSHESTGRAQNHEPGHLAPTRSGLLRPGSRPAWAGAR